MTVTRLTLTLDFAAWSTVPEKQQASVNMCSSEKFTEVQCGRKQENLQRLAKR
jgi:hypothetical protein